MKKTKTATKPNENQQTLMHKIVNKFINLFKKSPKSKQDLLAHFKQLELHNLIDRDELNMMSGVLLVSQMQVRDVMIPRSHMVVLQTQHDIKHQTKLITQSKHSRFPVIGENKDDIKGIILAKDILKHTMNDSDDLTLDKLIRPITFVPESKRLDSLLREFQISHNHMAMVMDEYGGIAGLVTIEDLIEQIIGKIEDEHFTPPEDDNIKKLSPNTYLVNAITPIEEFNRTCKTSVDDSYFDTIGGIVAQKFGYLPKNNEIITVNKIEFKIVSANARRIRFLEVRI